MKVNGNEMAITLRHDANLTALPFCNETLRQISDFYTLPATVDKRKPAVYIPVKKAIEGCFVSRLTLHKFPISNIKECYSFYLYNILYGLFG